MAAAASERLHAEFVQPLAKLLGAETPPCARRSSPPTLIGLAVMRHSLHLPPFDAAARRKAVARAGDAIQTCVNGNP